MTSPKKEQYCLDYLKKYTTCLLINTDVFGREKGITMCDYIKDIIDFSDCSEKLKKYDYENKEKFYDNIENLLHIIKSK